MQQKGGDQRRRAPTARWRKLGEKPQIEGKRILKPRYRCRQTEDGGEMMRLGRPTGKDGRGGGLGRGG